MGALFGGGGGSPPQGAGTSGTPSNAQAQYYQPQGQPGADQQYQNLLNTLYGQYSSGNTPSALYGPQAQNQSDTAFNLISGGGSAGGTTLNNVFSNPYAQEGIGAAEYLAQNVAPGITAAIPGLEQAGNQLIGAAPQLLASGFDPQNALFNRMQNDVTQQANAANAASGVTGPYAASTTDQALGNFDINWQNQQLQRQLQGAQGAAGAASAGGNIYGGLAPLAQGALGLKTAPGQAYLGQQQANQGALSNYLNQIGLSQGATTGGFNIGQGQYQLPESLLSNLGNYLKLGQNASLGSADLGQIGSQQATQGLQGLTGLGMLGSNALFGSSSPFSAANLGGQGSGLVGGLFGSGLSAGDAGALSGFGNAFDTGAGAIDLGTIGGGGGGGLLSFLGLAAG